MLEVTILTYVSSCSAYALVSSNPGILINVKSVEVLSTNVTRLSTHVREYPADKLRSATPHSAHQALYPGVIA